MSNSFSNQTLAQLDLWKNRDTYKVDGATLPKKLDEEAARLHLEKIGVEVDDVVGAAGGVYRGGRGSAPSRIIIATEEIAFQRPTRPREGVRPVVVEARLCRLQQRHRNRLRGHILSRV
ncbi:MAG: adenosylhomocysteinase [Bryobacteraceae bacterium]